MDKCVIIGGGTFNKVACHLALATPAFGSTARQLKEIFDRQADDSFETVLTLTKMADYNSDLVTNDDVSDYVDSLLIDNSVKAIIFNVALCDFSMENPTQMERLSSSDDYEVILTGIRSKIIEEIHRKRPDVITVGFKTTSNASPFEQAAKGFSLIENSKVDFVFANDVGSYNNILLTKDLEIYTSQRRYLLDALVTKVTRKIREARCYQYV